MSKVLQLRVPQTLVVIGGGSLGSTGGQFALEMAKIGTKTIVILFGRKLEQDLVDQIGKNNAEVVGIPCDFGNVDTADFSGGGIAESVMNALNSPANAGVKIDMVFCASGVTETGHFDKIPKGAALRMVKIGYIGPRLVLSKLVSQVNPGGLVLVLGSNHEFMASPQHADYASAKQALGAFVTNMARTAKKVHDVTVLYLATGWIWGITRHTNAVEKGSCPNEDQIVSSIPAGRIWRASEIAELALVMYTCPWSASFIGNKLVADGGDTGRPSGNLED